MKEWIIRRCTQQWIGQNLQYKNFLGACGPIIGSLLQEDLMSREEMLRALDVCCQTYPHDEFAGHNVKNCRCEEHRAFKANEQAHSTVRKGAAGEIARAARDGEIQP